MADLVPVRLTPILRSMLERINRHSGALLELAVTASGGREYTKLESLIRDGYVVRVDHPSMKAGKWPAEALAITDAGREALAGQPR
jgi:hypothetical protein